MKKKLSILLVLVFSSNFALGQTNISFQNIVVLLTQQQKQAVEKSYNNAWNEWASESDYPSPENIILIDNHYEELTSLIEGFSPSPSMTLSNFLIVQLMFMNDLNDVRGEFYNINSKLNYSQQDALVEYEAVMNSLLSLHFALWFSTLDI